MRYTNPLTHSLTEMVAIARIDVRAMCYWLRPASAKTVTFSVTLLLTLSKSVLARPSCRKTNRWQFFETRHICRRHDQKSSGALFSDTQCRNDKQRPQRWVGFIHWLGLVWLGRIFQHMWWVGLGWMRSTVIFSLHFVFVLILCAKTICERSVLTEYTL